MSLLEDSWLPSVELPVTPILGAIEFAECLDRCNGVSSLTCGAQCARSLDVHKRGLPVYVPFEARQLSRQFMGHSEYVDSNDKSPWTISQFIPNPRAPTILEFAERNP
jgi:hypothetical protein